MTDTVMAVKSGAHNTNSAALSRMAAIFGVDDAVLDRRVANEDGIPCSSERKQDRSFVLGRIASGQLFQDVKTIDVLDAITSVEEIGMNESIRDVLVGFLSGAANAVDAREEGRTGVVVRDGDGWSVCFAS